MPICYLSRAGRMLTKRNSRCFSSLPISKVYIEDSYVYPIYIPDYVFNNELRYVPNKEYHYVLPYEIDVLTSNHDLRIYK